MKNSFGWCSIFLIVFLAACNPDKDNPGASNDQINDWIYANMDYWYFWTDRMPEKPRTNVYPATYYENLLYSGDRFSFIYDNYQELIDLLNGVTLESGFEFRLFLEDKNDKKVVMRLSYVKKGSPADEIGLRRSDLIYEINGSRIDTLNYQSLLAQMQSAYSAKYKRYNFETEAFEDMGSFSITPVVFSENPIFLDTIYEIEGKKIGYFVYTFFSTGPTTGSSVYTEEMDGVFAKFKNAGISELIVDLRYNSGGSERSAVNLSSLLVNGGSGADLMFRKTYNDQVEEEIINDDELGPDFLTVNFLDKAQNIGAQLSSGTVYFITSNRSASASEVVVNSIRPYMGVYIVGDTTTGKDVGSITISDENNSSNNWALQPIIVKLVNSAGQDYPNGFIPNVPLKDNSLVIKQLGDVEELLLNTTLAAIGVQPARKDFGRPTRTYQEYFNSIDQKVRSGKFLMENPLK